MATRQYIAPFPADTDRDAFGHWVSGFTDGEGCFHLEYMRNHKWRHEYPVARFTIALRLDDVNILKTMQSYFQCGIIGKPRSYQSNANLSINWRTSKIGDLRNIIVPHFEKYPLRAKKIRDFTIWKQGVEFLYVLSLLIDNHRGTKRGAAYIWTPERHAHFSQLAIALKAQRKFDASIMEVPLAPTKKHVPSLFDGIA